MTSINLIFAHPYSDRSRANQALLRAVSDLPTVEVRALYDLYPDFDIDVEREQRALVNAEVIVWQHPMYWYSVPGLLKHWIDKVLTRGFAYGDGGVALKGKRCLWVTTTGGMASAFSPEGHHRFPLESFVPPIQQTAQFCSMEWEPPIVVHGAHTISDAALKGAANAYRDRLLTLAHEVEK
ncbi:MAG: glutathione-regulated potassium-efflux system oxidoreductase KefF [Polyangiaceae bacterium]|nr:glutathione-regulated potassium-efflux system oxidoreductase KefF [Polyangiaceae bacterium]